MQYNTMQYNAMQCNTFEIPSYRLIKFNCNKHTNTNKLLINTNFCIIISIFVTTGLSIIIKPLIDNIWFSKYIV